MNIEVITGVLEALAMKYGRGTVVTACEAFTRDNGIALSARDETVTITRAQYDEIAALGREGNKIAAIKLLRQYANPARPGALGLHTAKMMVETIPGVPPPVLWAQLD